MQSNRELEDNPHDLFQAIVDQAPDAVIYADRDGAIRVWNRTAEAIFGYAAAEVLGKSLDLIVPERFRNAHWKGFDEALETGHVKHAGRVLTTRSVHKNGSKLYVDLSFGLVKDSAGRPTGALAIGRDCTERHASGSAKPGDSSAGRADAER